MTSFVGRSDLLAEGGRLLELGNVRLVTLIGTGGVGKTRVAERLARGLSEAGRYKDGVVWVGLADLRTDDDRLASTIAQAVGIGDSATTAGLARLIEYLRDKDMLLVLDNCEQLIEETPGTGQVPKLVNNLLRYAPELHILATSRVSLRVQGEHLLTVPPLRDGSETTEDNGHEDLGHDGHMPEAVRLLIDRAAAVGVSIPERDYPLAARLCQLLDGLPLAIEIAAVQLDVRTLREIVEHPRLFQLLVDGPSEQRHHRTMRATLDWSHELLSDAEQRMLRIVSVFEGTFGLSAVTAVCGELGVDEDDVVRLLGRLVHKSLLVSEPHTGRSRYRMLGIVRQYGRDLQNRSQWAKACDAHAMYYARLTARSARESFNSSQMAWLSTMPLELANLRSAHSWLLSTRDGVSRALELSIDATRSRMWLYCGQLNEARRLLGLALDEHPDAPSIQQLQALSLSAWAAGMQGDTTFVTRLMAQAEEVARELDCYDTCGELLHSRGSALWLAEPNSARVREAQKLYIQADQAFRAEGKPIDASITTQLVAWTAAYLRDRELAFAQSTRQLAEAQEAGAQWCEAWALWTRALVELRCGDPHTAGDFAQKAFQLQTKIGDTWAPTWSLWLLAIIAIELGECRLGARLTGAVIANRRRTQNSIAGLRPWLGMQKQAEAQAREEIGHEEYDIDVQRGASLSPQEVYDLVGQPLPERPDRPRSQNPGGLSNREIEVAEWVSKGLGNKRIAKELELSPRTVEVHVHHILDKLNMTSRHEIMAWFLKQQSGTVS